MVQKPEQYRDRNRRRHFKSFAYNVGLRQKSCKKTSLQSQRDDQHQQETWSAPISNAFPYGHTLFSLSFLLLENKVWVQGNRNNFIDPQIETGNLSPGSDVFWVWGPTMDKIYFLQNLQLSYEKDILLHLRKICKTVRGQGIILNPGEDGTRKCTPWNILETNQLAPCVETVKP